MSKDKHEDEEQSEPNFPVLAVAWEKRAHSAERELEKLREINENKTIVLEQRAKIDTRTNILRVSIGLNCGLIAGLLVHFLASC